MPERLRFLPDRLDPARRARCVRHPEARSLLAVVGLVCVVLVACGGDTPSTSAADTPSTSAAESPSSPSTSSAGPLSTPSTSSADSLDVHTELCKTLAIDDPAKAAARFAARVHEPLHALIEAAQAEDPAVAARLRSDKQRVEASYADHSTLLANLDALAPVVDEALTLLGPPPPPCERR